MLTKLTTLTCLALAGGCMPYAAAQRDLAGEARNGVALVRQAHEQRKTTVRDELAFRRQMLDQAFDEDVRGRTTLDPDWVIAHRKGYAAGVDALNGQSAAIDQSDAAADANLAAIDQALSRIQWLAESETKWLGTVKRN